MRELSARTIRETLGMVTQDGHLFHESVRANLLLARPGVSDAELWDVLRRARLDALVAALPDGLDTVVGERGYRLSGGERQRLTIARVLLARPRVRADAEGVEVRNIGLARRLPWDQVVRVAFPDGASWARLDLPDYEYLPVMAVQSADGQRAVDAMRRLRALHAAATRADAGPARGPNTDELRALRAARPRRTILPAAVTPAPR